MQRSAAHRQLREIFQHVSDMRPAGLAVTLTEFNHALQHFVQQLPGRDHRHQCTQGRNEHRHQVQGEQADVHQMRHPPVVASRVGVSGGYRHAQPIVECALAHVGVQLVPRVDVDPQPLDRVGVEVQVWLVLRRAADMSRGLYDGVDRLEFGKGFSCVVLSPRWIRAQGHAPLRFIDAFLGEPPVVVSQVFFPDEP